MKDNTNYRIFRVNDNLHGSLIPRKITVEKITAENDDDAFEKLNLFISNSDKKYTYYVERWSPCQILIDGKIHEYDSIFEFWDDKKKYKGWFVRTYDFITKWSWRIFYDIPCSIIRLMRNTLYLIKHKQPYCASWCLDEVLLDTLLHNIPILKQYKQGVSQKMLNRAIIEKHGNMTKQELDEFNTIHGCDYGDELLNRAVELEYQIFDDLIDNINAYRYYMGGYSHIDINDEKAVMTDNKLRDTLPLIKGSYDSYDYDKLNELIENSWNKIWDIVKNYGMIFND